MLLYKPNVMILNFYVLENSVWLDSLFLIFFSVYGTLNLDENKSAFKALAS